MKVCPKCGARRFIAHQVVRMDVIVDGDNNWEESGKIYDSETPYGPYECENCGWQTDELTGLATL